MNRVLCELGHDSHEVELINVCLRGQPVVREYPAIPDHLATEFSMWVYKHVGYEGAQGYCPARDDVCLSLEKNRIWEGYETLLALEIFHCGDRSQIVLDFGAQLGWYSLLAAKAGYWTLAFDAYEENLKHLWNSAVVNKLDHTIMPVCLWLDEKTTPARFNWKNDNVLFLKADVEGAEEHVIRHCWQLIKDRKVQYLLLEISPCFNNSYLQIMLDLWKAGYDAFLVPSKPSKEVRDSFSAGPLGAIQDCLICPGDYAPFIADTYQENVLFIRR